MKVIELMNKVANREEIPDQIEYEGEVYIYRYDLEDYENEYYNDFKGYDCYKYLFENPLGKGYIEFFNDEVRMIEYKEDKKIEKIKIKDDKTIVVKGTLFYREKDMEIFQKLSMVINEIIDRLNGDSDE